MAALELVHPAELDFDAPSARIDHATIARLVKPKSKVLEIGCDDGALLQVLARERSVRARGLELDQKKVNACVARGFSVVQGDADTMLGDFPSGAFDYVILSHTLQTLKRPREALKHAARIGEHVIVSIENAAHWRARFALIGGRVRPARKAAFGEGEILHACSARDFVELARALGLALERGVPVSADHAGAPFAKTLWRANWFAEQVIFQVAR